MEFTSTDRKVSIRKKRISAVAAILVIVICASLYFGIRLFYDPISACEWRLQSVFTLEPFPHNEYYDPEMVGDADKDTYAIADPIEVICSAGGGVILLKDVKTGSVYEGAYIKRAQKNLFGRNGSVSYKVVFGEHEGNLSIIREHQLMEIVIDNKILYFKEIEK
ncbi:MAG: hypothetical protein J6L85_08020 [Clostridia bacterium]|nr:hypothetical protein [Clostridia bacterium]